MLSHDEILAALRVAVAKGAVLQKEVAEVLSIAPARITEVLKETRKIQVREMPILARYLGMEDDQPDASVRKIKRIGRVPAGSLRESLAETTDTIEVVSSLPKGVFALEVDGESMNTIAPLGCDVIVDPNDQQLFAGDLYVLRNDDGEFTFKRFLPDPARLVPLSDDPAHKDIALGAEPINIVGRVVSVILGANLLRRM